MIRSKWKRTLTWISFTLLWSLVFAAATLISRSLVQLEQAERDARRAAAIEENLRLALWRLDSILGPLLAQQSVAAISEPQNQISDTSVTASTLNLKDTLDSLPLRDPFRLDALAMTSDLDSSEKTRHETTLQRLREYSRFRTLALPVVNLDANLQTQIANGASNQLNRSRANTELSQRAQNLERTSQNFINNGLGMGGMGQPAGTVSFIQMREPLTAFWDDGKLLLARQSSPDSSAIEGWSIDWSALRQAMQLQIKDLLPEADFQPVEDVETQSSPDMLVSIPCLLLPGTVPGDFQDTVSDKSMPISFVLSALWLGVISAAIATGGLLGGALRLSDRRAAFVAAVTHELRTPLTTLQLYSEMLSSGMIQDEPTKQSYLLTLQNEVQRIGHLVENVFAFARLEKGRRPRSMERLSLQSLLERSQFRLEKLAERAEMQLVVEPNQAWDSEIMADASMIEQILVNLIDNAGKYAKDAEDRRIFLKVNETSDELQIAIQDCGNGFNKIKKWHQPFSKSVEQAAESAPGIGLGLSISQRFAKELGGKLLIGNTSQGACVTLVLPKAN